MTVEIKSIKVSKSFVLGVCICGCGTEIKLITARNKLQYWVHGHSLKGLKRENHPSYKTGKIKTAYGYIKILRPHHKHADKEGRVYEHRYRKELELGRYLKRKEHVHHIDENPSNNDESNLMLFASHSEHRRFHNNIMNRICLKCKSTTTWFNKKRNFYQWYHFKDGFICHKCYVKKVTK